ncbi:MAG: hypothetical protein KDN22_18295 [Verrucomicrobiae bacterium]|nr:hypothetical protein [Verrucomicrobiae bacterium]
MSQRSTPQRLPKTDVRYWLNAIYRRTFAGADTRARDVGHWTVKIQHAKRREEFPLHTPNKRKAAELARTIFISLKGVGWDSTLAEFKPEETCRLDIAGLSADSDGLTLGQFIAAAEEAANVGTRTLADYSRSLRRIASGVFKLEGSAKKFDYRTGGRNEWRKQIDAILLSAFTPERIQAWKKQFVAAAGTDIKAQNRARTSVNSIIRQAKSLFSPKLLRFIALDPKPQSPFEGVDFEPRSSTRYHSGEFDLLLLLRLAQHGSDEVKKLPCEQLKIFLLASMAGLRRKEIDLLEWSSVRFDQQVIRIRATEFFKPKSEDSVGDVGIDAELAAFFRKACDSAKGKFVIESDAPPPINQSHAAYRCDEHFKPLLLWLRANGLNGRSPLHTLRKEFGSIICEHHGIYAASRALRHADINVTTAFYVDRKKPAAPGLGAAISL